MDNLKKYIYTSKDLKIELDKILQYDLNNINSSQKSNIENLADDDDFGDIEGEYEDF